MAGWHTYEISTGSAVEDSILGVSNKVVYSMAKFMEHQDYLLMLQ